MNEFMTASMRKQHRFSGNSSEFAGELVDVASFVHRPCQETPIVNERTRGNDSEEEEEEEWVLTSDAKGELRLPVLRL